MKTVMTYLGRKGQIITEQCFSEELLHICSSGLRKLVYHLVHTISIAPGSHGQS